MIHDCSYCGDPADHHEGPPPAICHPCARDAHGEEVADRRYADGERSR